MGKADNNKAELAQALYIPLAAWERWLGRWRDVYLASKRGWYALRNVYHKQGSHMRWYVCHIRAYWRLLLGPEWCFGLCQLFCRQVSSTLLMQSWCWLICWWLHWHRGFRLNPLGSAWLIAFCWVRLGTVKLLKQPEEQGLQEPVFCGEGAVYVVEECLRGFTKCCSECCSKVRRSSLARILSLSQVWSQGLCLQWMAVVLAPSPSWMHMHLYFMLLCSAGFGQTVGSSAGKYLSKWWPFSLR